LLQYILQNPLSLQNDDSTIRSLQLAQLALNTHLTFQALEALNREMEILALAPPPSAPNAAPPSDLRERESRNPNPGFSDRLDNLSSLRALNNMSGPILDKSGRPLQVFTLLDKRQQFADGVFKSGHNLPTMTIDEYLEEERKRGGIIEGGGEASGVVTEVDEDDYDAGERETKKAREWDEYVEANPKGSGNTLNRG
jgi:immunoglobulin-binding protein 1